MLSLRLVANPMARLHCSQISRSKLMWHQISSAASCGIFVYVSLGALLYKHPVDVQQLSRQL